MAYRDRRQTPRETGIDTVTALCRQKNWPALLEDVTSMIQPNNHVQCETIYIGGPPAT